jgi:hypothetical protein
MLVQADKVRRQAESGFVEIENMGKDVSATT